MENNKTLTLQFSNLDEFKELLKKAERDVEVLKLNIENLRNFKINVSQK